MRRSSTRGLFGRLPRALALVAVLLPVRAGAQAAGAQAGFATADDGVRLAYEVIGSGDTMIILHGGPGLGMRYLQPGLAPLADAHTLVFFDQRGAGNSSLPDSTGYSLYDYVNDIEAVRRHLGGPRITLLGHSWGAALGALYAAAYPQHLRALVLVAPMPPRALWADSTSAGARRALDAGRAAELGRLAREMLTGDDPAAACRAHMRLLLGMMSVAAPDSAAARCDAPAATIRARDRVVRWTTRPLGAWDWRGTVAWITTPTLIVHGTDDSVPEAAAREWAGTIAGARLIVLPGARHMPQVDAPDRFRTELQSFLRRAFRQGWPGGPRGR
ncbi:MAG TPA: alpha/beta fold hydrolase [Longimicrobiales bacterium]|nr:alpha/beta fold hydrolase [Longimicrobiales bacterium]